MTTRDVEDETTLEAGAAPPPRAWDALEALYRSDPVFAERYGGWDELGCGAGASVIRTHLRDAGMAVAVKVLWPREPDEVLSLRAEARALMRVVHPAVLRTFAVFDRGALGWIEMELIDGPSLRDEIRARAARGEPWPLEQALEIGACLAEGLAAVHACGFVHRDVKPGNVLLPRDGRPAAKLADFGIARSLEGTVWIEDTLPGSPKYICPEALDGRRVGPAGDVYALSLTLYQLFSGGLFPFALGERPTLAETLACHQHKAPIPLRALGLRLPEAVVDVVQRGLQKQPARRPTASEVARVLRDVQQGTAADSPKPLRRLSVPVALGLGLVLGAGLVLAGLWLLMR